MVAALRDAAFARFAELGFPTTHNEEWRFTNVAPIARTAFTAPAPDALTWSAPESVAETGSGTGGIAPCPARRFRSERVRGPEHRVSRQRDGPRNPARPSRRERLRRLRNTGRVEQPCRNQPTLPERLRGNDALPAAGSQCPSAVHPRTLILVGANAQCTIVETYKGAGTYFTNAVTEIVVGDRAVVDHYKVQQESVNAFHIATLQATIGRSATFRLALHFARRRAGPQRRQRHPLRRLRRHPQRPLHRQRHAARRQSHHDRPHQAARHQPRTLQGHSRRQGATPSSTAKSSSARTRRRPIPSRPTRTWSSPTTPWWIPNRSCRSSPTTCAAPMAPPSASSTPKPCSTCNRAASARSQARSLLTYAFAQDIVDRIKVQSLRDSLERILFEKFHEHAE